MDLKVATYNVHRCLGGDKRRDPERVALVIRELDADIIGLQEVDSPVGRTSKMAQTIDLAEATGMNALSGPTIRRRHGSYGNVLLTNWRILEGRKTDLSVTGREPRGVIQAAVEVRGRVVRIIVTHLGLRTWERKLQVRRLLEILEKTEDEPLVLLSDFNEWFPFSRSILRVTRRLGGCPSPFVPTYPARLPLLALDRIWVDPPRNLREIRAHKTTLSRIASDHLPLVASIRL